MRISGGPKLRRQVMAAGNGSQEGQSCHRRACQRGNTFRVFRVEEDLTWSVTSYYCYFDVFSQVFYELQTSKLSSDYLACLVFIVLILEIRIIQLSFCQKKISLLFDVFSCRIFSRGSNFPLPLWLSVNIDIDESWTFGCNKETTRGRGTARKCSKLASRA